jgi:hypothetical protein
VNKRRGDRYHTKDKEIKFHCYNALKYSGLKATLPASA